MESKPTMKNVMMAILKIMIVALPIANMNPLPLFAELQLVSAIQQNIVLELHSLVLLILTQPPYADLFKENVIYQNIAIIMMRLFLIALLMFPNQTKPLVMTTMPALTLPLVLLEPVMELMFTVKVFVEMVS